MINRQQTVGNKGSLHSFSPSTYKHCPSTYKHLKFNEGVKFKRAILQLSPHEDQRVLSKKIFSLSALKFKHSLNSNRYNKNDNVKKVYYY